MPVNFQLKKKQDFRIREGSFSQFYAEINFSRLIRNLQYAPIFSAKFHKYILI